jgi:S-adenosyl-L-methionine hydrolase (adenosine-forming)
MAPITFLSDYGLDDEFVGVVHGVIARLAPDARIIDLTHGIRRHDVVAGALALRSALPFTPPGVHLAVVDPGVGGERCAVALRCAQDGRLLVGPDNGVLALAAETFGGVVEAAEVSRSPWRLEPVSATFHGRDVFAPVAARLAAGAPLAEAGEPLDPDDLAPLPLPAPRFEAGGVVAAVLAIDRFGNAILGASHEDLAATGLRLGRAVTVAAGGQASPAQFARTFAEVPPGALLLYEDAGRSLAVAVNRGSAAEDLGLAVGAEVRIEPAG